MEMKPARFKRTYLHIKSSLSSLRATNIHRHPLLAILVKVITPMPNGTLWVRTFDEVNAVANEFSTCGTNETTGTGFIEGIARLYISGTPVSDLPTLTTATASAEQNETNTYDGVLSPDPR